ncbi:hypothetical protein ACMD2_08502 [Ananas comosus]|uniref:Uncharacterized protein n=1 Tax=Ananas comosus TaxID=4615 RepID=A0A199V3U5_ANACO|nr:hypothetical protein ACMD2_08502 [Ananas comosus]
MSKSTPSRTALPSGLAEDVPPRVRAGATANRENDFDAVGLARSNVAGEVGAGIGVGVAVPREVELRGAAGAEAAEEG